MHTDILLQQIHAAHIDSQRLNDALRHEQLRIARAGRPGIAHQALTAIGMMLIALGQRLQAEPSASRKPQMA